MIHRPCPIHCIPSEKPSPTSPSTWSSGTRTFSKKSSAGDQPPIVGTGREVQPIERSTRKQVTPPFWGGFVRSVTAKTMVKSASLPPVINTFCPLMTQWPPSLTALVRIEEGPEPAPGSVRAKHDLRSPCMLRTPHSTFFHSFPYQTKFSPFPPTLPATT